MAITNSTVFDKVLLYPFRGSVPSISVYNGNTHVSRIRADRSSETFDTSTDEFQIILAAIQEGTAYEEYRFEEDSYTDANLPSWLSWAKDQNPFHVVSQLQVSADPKPLTQYYFKEVPTTEDPVDLTPPSLEYTSAALLRTGLRAAGWYQQKALVQQDPDNSILLVLRTLETQTPIVTNDQVTGYNFTAISNGVTADTAQYSSDDGHTWHGTLEDNDTQISTLLTDGTWHIQELSPSEIIIPSGTTKKVERGSVVGAYTQSAFKNINIGGTALADIVSIEARVDFYHSWAQLHRIKLSNVIAFPRRSLNMITPGQQHQKQVLDLDDAYRMAWQYSIDGTTAKIDQGGITNETIDRNNKNVGWVSLVSYPQMVPYETFNNGSQISVSSGAGLEAGDILFLDHEQMRFESVEGGIDHFTQTIGYPTQTINVTRAINGTTRRTHEHSYFITGIVNARDVLRYVSFWNMTGPTEWPFRFYLSLEQTAS